MFSPAYTPMTAEDMVSLALLFFAAIFIITVWSAWADERDGKNWGTAPIDEGVYDRVIYGYDTYEERSGAMVHTTHTCKMDCTAIYFQDGRTRVCNKRVSIPYPAGTRIQIWGNRAGGYKIEKTGGKNEHA